MEVEALQLFLAICVPKRIIFTDSLTSFLVLK